MEDGTQYERCNGCGQLVNMDHMYYADPTEQYQYGLDLCDVCMDIYENEPQWFEHMKKALKETWEHGKRVGGDEMKHKHNITEPGDVKYTFTEVK